MKLIAALISLILLTNCGSGKTNTSQISFENNPPFNLINSYYQDWVAGVKEGGSGTNIHLRFQTMAPEVELKDVYFKKHIIPLERKMTSAIAYVASIKNDNNRPDVVMDSDPVKEAVNTPPKKLPFLLEATDAVISYTYQGKLHFYKIENINRKEMVAYPAANPKGDN